MKLHMRQPTLLLIHSRFSTRSVYIYCSYKWPIYLSNPTTKQQKTMMQTLFLIETISVHYPWMELASHNAVSSYMLRTVFQLTRVIEVTLVKMEELNPPIRTGLCQFSTPKRYNYSSFVSLSVIDYFGLCRTWNCCIWITRIHTILREKLG